MIKNFESFLNENVRPRTYESESFIDEAFDALTSAGFVITNLSTPTQKKNDNLACEISFPGILEFVEEYYSIGKDRVVYNGNLENFVKSFRITRTIYKIGNVMTPGSSSPDCKFSSIPELVKNMKILFGSRLVSNQLGFFGVERDLKMSGQSCSVFPNDIRIDTKSTYRTSGIGYDIGIPPLRKKLPDSAISILNNICSGFSTLYKKIYSISPEYLEYATDVYCAFIEFYYLEISHAKFVISADLSTIISDLTSNSWIAITSNTVNVRKQKVHMKVTYYGEQAYYSGYGKDGNLLGTYTDKFKKMTEDQLDSYFNDYLTTKRGMITGKKYGL